MWGVWLSTTCVLGEWLSGPPVISGDRASRIRQAECADKNIPNGIVLFFSAAVAGGNRLRNSGKYLLKTCANWPFPYMVSCPFLFKNNDKKNLS